MSEEHTGLSVSYYTVEVKHPTSENGGITSPAPYVAQCNDIIESLNMTFAEGNAFKAIWRTAAARRGLKKKGNNSLYDAEKVVFFGQRMVEKAKYENLSKELPLVPQPDICLATCPDLSKCGFQDGPRCPGERLSGTHTGAAAANPGLSEARYSANTASGVTASHLSLDEVMAQWQQRQDMEEAMREDTEPLWRSWGGTGYPVARRVEVKFRDGDHDMGFAEHFYWHHNGDEGDIMAYRELTNTLLGDTR